MKRIIIRIFTPCLLLGTGIVIGVIVNDVPFIDLKKEVSLGEAGNFLLALAIAFVVPLLLTQWLDKKRNIKDILIDDIKDCIKELSVTKAKIDGCGISGTTTATNKREILFRFKQTGMLLHSLREQLEVSFEGESKEMRNELLLKDLEYHREVTGGELMNEGFVISNSFCVTHDNAFGKIQSYLKKCIHLVNEF